MSADMDRALSWLDDELLALNDAEEAMGKNDVLNTHFLGGNTPATETSMKKVTHSTELPKSQRSSAHTKRTTDTKPKKKTENSPKKDPEPPKINNIEKKSEEKPFPNLDLGFVESISPKINDSMAKFPAPTPLGSGKNQEDELEFFTKSLIDKMNSPGDKDMYGYCGKCNGIVEGEDTGCKAMDDVFHIDCFRCKTCERNLHKMTFYLHEKETYCEPCYMNSLEKCTVCSEVISDRILRATGKPYHAACFTCVVCRKCLDGVPFTVDVTNQIHCVDCFVQKFAPKCSVCNEPIMPEPGQEETVRIVALDRSFHIDCYKCEKCGTKLSGDGNGCFPLDGRILCKDCNTAMVQELSNNI